MGQKPPQLPRQTPEKPVLYLLAGPNGAGKTTLYQALVLAGTLPGSAEFVNADLHEAQHLKHVANAQARSEQARRWADARRAELLRAGRSFVSETVFSHGSKLALIEEAQAQGFFVMLLVVALDQPQRLLGRVAQRVAEGGHPVPADRILARYQHHEKCQEQGRHNVVLQDCIDFSVNRFTRHAQRLCPVQW